jgi:hypothetical protein
MASRFDSIDMDATRFVLLDLWDNDSQNPVFKASTDTILIYMRWEGEGAGELADAALSKPVFGLFVMFVVLMWLLRLGFALLGSFAFKSSMRRWAFDKPRRRVSRGVVSLGLSTYDHCLRLSKLEVYLLLFHTSKLPMELVSLRRLADIKLGLPVDHSSVMGILISSGVRVVIFEESEDWVKGRFRIVKAAREKSHCA